MRYIKLTIPVKPYVRKYIEAKFKQPIKLTTKTTIGYILFSLLEKRTNPFKESKEILHIRYKRLTDEVYILLPTNAAHVNRNGCMALEAKAVLINNFFEKRIREELFSFCNLYFSLKIPQRQAIEDFRKNYDILLGVDIRYDALRQADFRYRKSFKKSITEMSRA